MTETINLLMNYPSVIEEGIILKNYFTEFLQSNPEGMLAFPPYQGGPVTLIEAGKWMKVSPSDLSGRVKIISCNSGNHALTCILQEIRKNHSTIITESFTFPAFKTIAKSNGIKIKGCKCDDNGMILEELEKAVEESASKVVYLQPTIQNPTCFVMSIKRRQEIAGFVREKNLLIIEDDAYRFLHRNPPPRFLDLIPENTLHICSLSKPFNPLIKTAFLVVPEAFSDGLTSQVRFSSSGNSSLLNELSTYLMRTKVIDMVVAQKQEKAEGLQAMAKEIFKGLAFQNFPTSFHMVKIASKYKIKRFGNFIGCQQNYLGRREGFFSRGF